MRSEPTKDTAATGVSQICAASRVKSSRTGSGAELSTSYWVEGLDPQSFVFDQESVHFDTYSIVGVCKSLRTPTFVQQQ